MGCNTPGSDLIFSQALKGDGCEAKEHNGQVVMHRHAFCSYLDLLLQLGDICWGSVCLANDDNMGPALALMQTVLQPKFRDAVQVLDLHCKAVLQLAECQQVRHCPPCRREISEAFLSSVISVSTNFSSHAPRILLLVQHRTLNTALAL